MITKAVLKQYIKHEYPNKYERKTALETWLTRYLCRLSGYDIESHLKDIATYGCVSGCVGELIYNHDIIKFYAKYESQIWTAIYDYLQNTGQTLGQFLDSLNKDIEDETSLKISLSWFVIDYLAYRFLDQFNVAY